MWHDVETDDDLLNFNTVADVAVRLIEDSGDKPISIGVSGGWGTGKSSLVEMIRVKIQTSDADRKRYLFVKFNAWLYQGFDDAKMALLHAVADELYAAAEGDQTLLDKVKEFIGRIKWLKVTRILAPAAISAATGHPVPGVFGSLMQLGQEFFASGPSADMAKKGLEAASAAEKEFAGLLKEKLDKSPPKEIQELRDALESLLEAMNLNLVVFVDDLDRCLPATAISTLEAIRLLLFMKRTAFIIAADERMIRHAVRAHFSEAQLDDDLVTSYFDKLIQVPLRVPRLGTNEIKAYLALLFANLAVRRGQIDEACYQAGRTSILAAAVRSWAGALTIKVMREAFGDGAGKIQTRLDLADQLAHLMATADQIAGNPRLIKRFLNNLVIREAIAESQGMAIAFEEMVKLQLFERCASPAAFEFLAMKVAESEDGKPVFLVEIEQALQQDEPYKAPHPSWETPFIADWLKLSPPLALVDLRPLLHLSRDRTVSIASYDEISPEAREVLEAIIRAQDIQNNLVERVKALGESEAEIVLNRLKRRVRTEQWDVDSIRRCLHVIRAYTNLADSFLSLLRELPAEKRDPSLVPLLAQYEWAKELFAEWAEDVRTPSSSKKAIQLLAGRRGH